MVVSANYFAHIYSFSTGIWTSGLALPKQFYRGAFVLYPNGFLMVGGANSKFITEFHAENKTFTTWTKTMAARRSNHFALLITDDDLRCN